MQPDLGGLSLTEDQVAWKSLKALIIRFNFSEKEAITLLGDMPRSSYYKGISQFEGRLNRDTKARISYLLGVYKSLRILFTDSQQAITWIDRPNSLPPFNGLTPRSYLMEGSQLHLAQVRQFLDFWRGY